MPSFWRINSYFLLGCLGGSKCRKRPACSENKSGIQNNKAQPLYMRCYRQGPWKPDNRRVSSSNNLESHNCWYLQTCKIWGYPNCTMHHSEAILQDFLIKKDSLGRLMSCIVEISWTSWEVDCRLCRNLCSHLLSISLGGTYCFLQQNTDIQLAQACRGNLRPWESGYAFCSWGSRVLPRCIGQRR